MTSSAASTAIADARSVSTAASALARALREGRGREFDAQEQLELQGTLAIDQSKAGFDATAGAELSDDDLLAMSVSQFGIGLTLVSAEAAISSQGGTEQLNQAVRFLERAADDLEAGDADPTFIEHFDTQPNGFRLDPQAAAMAALDEMATSAASVATCVLDKALKPFIDKLPSQLTDVVGKLELNVGGQMAELGLRAVRRGLDLLLRLVDIGAIERMRDRVESVLERLGKGEDSVVLIGWAIGVEGVRDAIKRAAATGVQGADAGDGAIAATEDAVDVLAHLASAYAKICTLLRKIAIAVVALTGILALLQITFPHGLAITTVGLAIVLGAVVVIGRDYTGATDLPGSVRGVRAVMGNTDAPV